MTSSLNVKAIEMDEYMISKSKKATPLDENLQTTVTLSLPSVDETSCINCVDIVFVMDDSTSTTNAGIDFSVQVKELVETLIEKKIDVKIGIIKFKGTANDAIEYADPVDKKQVGIEIHSGKNRIVRRIFESFGYKVLKLDRVQFAGLTKKNLRRGDWRYLTEEEVDRLRMGAYE